MNLFYQLLTLAILLLLSAFFSASETALISMSKLRVKHLLKLKKRGAKELQKLKDEPRRILITILIGNNLVNVSASAIATMLTLDIFGSAALSYSIGITTFILLVFGEITPKSLANHYNRQISLWVAKPIYYMSRIMHPLIVFFDSISTVFFKVFKKEKNHPLITKSEIETIVEIGEDIGALKKMEEVLIKNVFRFDDILVEEIMTSKERMFCLESETRIKDAIPTLLNKPYTRIPIYMQHSDNVLGFISKDDILRCYANHQAHIPLRLILKPIPCIFRDEKLDVLLKQFLHNHIHIAAVITRDHKLLGIVTLEDLLEELVGEIIDEKEIEALKLQKK